MKVYKKDKKIIFEFPEEQKRCNPYNHMYQDKVEKCEDVGCTGTYPTFTGLIVRNNKDGNDYDEIGFAGTIDMSYKDKGDQVSDFIVKWWGEEEEFRKICKELGIGIFEMDM